MFGTGQSYTDIVSETEGGEDGDEEGGKKKKKGKKSGGDKEKVIVHAVAAVAWVRKVNGLANTLLPPLATLFRSCDNFLLVCTDLA